MSEHDEAGRALAFPPFLPPPPPPQPAARSASTAVRPISAVSESLLLTLPPSVAHTGASPHAPARPAPRGGQVSGQSGPYCNSEPGATVGFSPKWRNWQTRRTQNPVGETSCGFESHLRHRLVERNGVGAPSDRLLRGQRGGLGSQSLACRLFSRSWGSS